MVNKEIFVISESHKHVAKPSNIKSLEFKISRGQIYSCYFTPEKAEYGSSLVQDQGSAEPDLC